MNVDRQSERHGSGPHAMFTSEQHILLEDFRVIKHAFAGVPKEDFLKLPNGIGEDKDDIPLRGGVANHVRITAYEYLFLWPPEAVLTRLQRRLSCNV
jgi:hypothetical protein